MGSLKVVIKNTSEELKDREQDLSGNVQPENTNISKLKDELNKYTKQINDALEIDKERKEEKKMITILTNFSKSLKNLLKKIDEKEHKEWDFYGICKLLRLAMKEWCNKTSLFSEQVICYVLSGLTGKDWNSVPQIDSSTNNVINIKNSDKSLNNNDVKESLKNLMISLVKVYFHYGVKIPKEKVKKSKVKAKSPLEGIKEFKREEIKNGDNKGQLGEGGIGSVHKIQYKGKNGQIKTKVEKMLQKGHTIDGITPQEHAQAWIKGNTLIENKIKDIRRTYKHKRKVYKELLKKIGKDSVADNKELQELKQELDKLKDNYRRIAFVKVRKKDKGYSEENKGYSMISDLGEGDLSKFYYLDKKANPNLNPIDPRTLDSEEEVDQLFNDLTAGVEQLHKMGLVHGDIKPTNFLAYKSKSRSKSKGEGKGLKYKISDFDTASEVEGYDDVNSHTYHYIPDCYNVKNKIPNGEMAKKVDCYSLCMTLREIFNQDKNFGGKNSQYIQNYAKGLVSTYENEKGCSKGEFL